MGANAIQIGEIILAHREQDFHRHGLEVELLRAHRIVTKRSRRTVLNQIRELDDERVSLRGAGRRFPAESEEFLELVERQEGRNQVIAGTPEMVALAMKVLPQRLVRPGWRRFHSRR